MTRWGVMCGLLWAVFAGQAEPVISDQRLSKLEAQMALVTDLAQQQSDMKDQMLQINGQLEKVTHDLEAMKVENTHLTQLITDLTQSRNQTDTKKEGPPIVSLNPSSPPKVPNDQAAYEAAYQFVTENEYDSAIAAFNRFVKQYPDSTQVSAAHYWLGELHMALEHSDKAIIEFLWVLNNDPGSLYAPEAVFKLGTLYKLTGDNLSAKKMFTKVIDDYPKSQAATNARQKLRTDF